MGFEDIILNAINRGEKPLGSRESFDGIVIKISKDLVAKIYKDHRSEMRNYPSPQKIASKEYRIGNYLFNERVSVPKMKEIIEVKKINRWALVMEFIPGYNLEELPKKYLDKRIYRKIENKKNFQIEKAKTSFVTPAHDAIYDDNVMFNPDKNRVYLIDFVKWLEKGYENLFS